LSIRPALALLLLCVLGAPAAARSIHPLWSGTDRKLPRIHVSLEPLRVKGRRVRFATPTDLALLPSDALPERILVVAEKRGDLRWLDLETGESGFALEIRPVGSYTEEGLLGFAFHPNFTENRRFYTYHTDPRGAGTQSVITEWTWEDADGRGRHAGSPRELLRVRQPQEGHHAGQIAFGPDGMLYIGFGDGGFQRDPGNRAQDPSLFQGKMLRIDVDTRTGDKPYGVPGDNPWVDGPFQPEVWATGFRNPWRYDFGPDGTLVVADVGQDRWEEIDVVRRGGNYGWSLKEGFECFAADRQRAGSCADPALQDPVWVYGRAQGNAVVGGRFWTDPRSPELLGRFVFGDAVTGRLWALRPPADGQPVDVAALGRFLVSWDCFGRGPGGEVWGATFGGSIMKIVPSHPAGK
jgi:glucose/arabinose dehydrogenase